MSHAVSNTKTCEENTSLRFRTNVSLQFRSLFFKGFLNVAKKLQALTDCRLSLAEEIESAADEFHYKEPKSSQYFQEVYDFLFNYPLKI